MRANNKERTTLTNTEALMRLAETADERALRRLIWRFDRGWAEEQDPELAAQFETMAERFRTIYSRRFAKTINRTK
jgi:hypothetical protein